MRLYSLLLLSIILPHLSVAEPHKLGALLCLTGTCAESGTESVNGAKLALSEWNERGGLFGEKLELVIEDSAEDQGQARSTSAFLRLKNQGDIRFILGPTWSAAGLAIAPIAAKSPKILMISPSLGVKGFNEAAPNLFNVWPHDEVATRSLAAFAIKKGWRRAAIFGSQNSWSSTQDDTFVAEFGKLGGEVVARVEPLEGVLDLKTEAGTIHRSKPDVVFYSIFAEQMGIAARELARTGFKGAQVAPWMLETSLHFAPKELEGLYLVKYENSTPEFQEKYKAAFNKMPGISADTAYDAVNIYLSAAREVGSFEATKVGEKINALRGVKGASGTVSFDGKGGVLRTPLLHEVRNAKFVRSTEEF